MTLFTVGDEPNHHIGDLQRPECLDEYPEPCRCGGLMHAAGGVDGDAETAEFSRRPAAIGAGAPRTSWTIN